jgi:dTMP kinase
VTDPPRSRTPSGAGTARSGFFLTLEGIEGSGKTTHAERLAATLKSRGFQVTRTREPGGTPLAEAMRSLVLGTEGEAPVPEAELLLILAARAQHVQRLILPRLEAGDVVICDRFFDASLAYQGGGRRLGLELVRGANRVATGGLVPDLTLLFDLPVETALRRIQKRNASGGTYDRIDREAQAFHERVRATYLELARTEPDRFLVVTSDEDKEEVTARVAGAVLARLEARRAEGGPA